MRECCVRSRSLRGIASQRTLSLECRGWLSGESFALDFSLFGLGDEGRRIDFERAMLAGGGEDCRGGVAGPVVIDGRKKEEFGPEVIFTWSLSAPAFVNVNQVSTSIPRISHDLQLIFLKIIW